jgi:parvulin-like peptidyl-prolyl isomerase
LRQKSYHNNLSQKDVTAIQREVAQKQADRLILLARAKQEGVAPDKEEVDREMARFEQRYGKSEQWKTLQHTALPALRARLEQDSQVKRLVSQYRLAPEPTAEQLTAFYEGNKPLFTEPEQNRVAVILLKVDPSSPSIAWQKAQEEGQSLFGRIKAGADFAELARLHSADASGAKGGDMGYLHQGMLPEEVQAELNKAQPGEVLPPIRVLEGVVVVRLLERKPAQQRTQAEVAERLKGLWLRKAQDEAWAARLAAWRQEAKIESAKDIYLLFAQDGAPNTVK